MTAPERVMGREPLQIVELEQPRCVHRFGSAPCTASGTPKCYQTFTTCLDRPNFDSNGGSIKWRFVGTRKDISAWGDYSDEDNSATDGLPGLLSVKESAAQINIAGILKGQNPLGIRAKVSVQLEDFLFGDTIGDFYLDDRTLGEATFWEKWTVRNRFYAGMYLRVYDGFNGQRLEDMRRSLYVVEGVDGPANGGVSITGIDPLSLAKDGKAQFPRATAVYLVGDIDADGTDITVLATDETDLSEQFGNTTESYIRIGDEVLSFTGYTATGDDNTYTLDGVARGALGTDADEFEEGDAMQRVGHYDLMHIWKIAHDLIDNHTAIPSDLYDLSEWNDIAQGYLARFTVCGTVAEPTDVADLLGELCQQGQFSMWWDVYSQKVKILVVQPPLGDVPELTDDAHILADGVSYTRLPKERLTRIFLYYTPISVVGDMGDSDNFKTLELRVDSDAESPYASDTPVTRNIYSRWLNTRQQALSVTKRMIDNYGGIPERFSCVVDAKDRATAMGAVFDIQTREFKDTEGNLERRRWQVVKVETIKAGSKYQVTFQRFPYSGRYGIYMADDAPVYTGATDTQKEFGGFYADSDGKMSNGDEGYKYR